MITKHIIIRSEEQSFNGIKIYFEGDVAGTIDGGIAELTTDQFHALKDALLNAEKEFTFLQK